MYRPRNLKKLPMAQVGICYDEMGSPIECDQEQQFKTDPNTGYQYSPDYFNPDFIPGLSNFLKRKQQGLSTNPFKSTGNEGMDSNPMNRGVVETSPVKTPTNNKIDPYFLLKGATNGLSWLSGIVDRKRQNQYDYQQQSALGMMNPMPTADFQPTAYSLYAKYGGSIKTHLTNLQKEYSNNAQMDMTDGLYPEMMGMKKGGLTPNKARQILHDGTAQGHPLTDKQRRYFGAMSKGHTNRFQKGGEYKGSSVVDYLATKGYSGNKGFRKELASKYNIENYDFSAQKNLELLAKLKEDSKILEENKRAFTPISVDRMNQMEQEVLSRRNVSKYRGTSTPPITTSSSDNSTPVIENKAPVSNWRDNTYNPNSLFSTSSNKFANAGRKANPIEKDTKPTSNWRDNNTDIDPDWRGNRYDPSYLTKFELKFYKNPTEETKPETKGADWKTNSYNSSSLNNDLMRYRGLTKFGKVGTRKVGNTSEAMKVSVSADNSEHIKPYLQMNGVGGLDTREWSKDVIASGYNTIRDNGYTLAQNWFDRRNAKNNPEDPTAISKLEIPKPQPTQEKVPDTPPVIMGEPIKDNDRVYHAPMIVDLNRVSVGSRSRKEGWDSKAPVETAGMLFSTMGGFGNDMINSNTQKDKISDTALYIGHDPQGKIKIGKGVEFKGKNYSVSSYPYMMIKGFVKDGKGNYKLGPNAYNKTHGFPVVKTADDKESTMNTILSRVKDESNLYGRLAGGKAIFATPDFSKKIFVSGSTKTLDEQLEKFKKDNKVDKVVYIQVDNGSQGRTYQTTDNKMTAEDWKALDLRDELGGAGFYLKGKGY